MTQLAEDHDLRFHIQGRKVYLTQLFLDWEVKVRRIPQAWEMPASWGPTPADVASGLCFRHQTSTAHAPQHEVLRMGEEDVDDIDSDAERWLDTGEDFDDEFLDEEDLDLDANGLSDEEGGVDDYDLGYVVSSPLGPRSSKKVRYEY